MLVYSTLNNNQSQENQERNESDDDSQDNRGVVADIDRVDDVTGTSSDAPNEDENSKTCDEVYPAVTDPVGHSSAVDLEDEHCNS